MVTVLASLTYFFAAPAAAQPARPISFTPVNAVVAPASVISPARMAIVDSHRSQSMLAPLVVRPARTTPSTVPAAVRPPVAVPTTVSPPPAAVLATRPSTPAPAVAPQTTGCAAALAYLSSHAAPGFTIECPGNAMGHQAMTCVNSPGVCSGEKLIAIADPCPAAYMNEASNSWVLTGQSSAPIDPYGSCS